MSATTKLSSTQLIIASIDADPERAQEIVFHYSMLMGLRCKANPTFNTLQLIKQPYVKARDVLRQLKQAGGKFDFKLAYNAITVEQEAMIDKKAGEAVAKVAEESQAWKFTKAVKAAEAKAFENLKNTYGKVVIPVLKTLN